MQALLGFSSEARWLRFARAHLRYLFPGLRLLRPARKCEPEPAASRFFRPLRQVIESVNDTFKGQLDLERHGGHTPEGVTVRVLQRILALTAAIWHNDNTCRVPKLCHGP